MCAATGVTSTADLTAADIISVHNCIADYALCLDDAKTSREAWKRWEELWTEDAVFRANRDLAGTGTVQKGRAEILNAFTAILDRGTKRLAEEGFYTRHYVTNIRIEVTDGDVIATSAMVAVRHSRSADGEEIFVGRSGKYIDRLVRDAGQWRFAERQLYYDPPDAS